MDDLDFGNDIVEFLGLPPNDSSSAEQKIGEERLGSPNPFGSLGVTVILISIIFILIVIAIFISSLILRRNEKECPKCRKFV